MFRNPLKHLQSPFGQCRAVQVSSCLAWTFGEGTGRKRKYSAAPPGPAIRTKMACSGPGVTALMRQIPQWAVMIVHQTSNRSALCCSVVDYYFAMGCSVDGCSVGGSESETLWTPCRKGCCSAAPKHSACFGSQAGSSAFLEFLPAPAACPVSGTVRWKDCSVAVCLLQFPCLGCCPCPPQFLFRAFRMSAASDCESKHPGPARTLDSVLQNPSAVLAAGRNPRADSCS